MAWRGRGRRWSARAGRRADPHAENRQGVASFAQAYSSAQTRRKSRSRCSAWHAYATTLRRLNAAPGLRHAAQASQGEQPRRARGGARHRVRGCGTGGGFEKITLPLHRGAGRAAGQWVDHHDSDEHVRYAGDPRFVLSTKAEHGACPEMITPELVARAGPHRHHRVPHRLRRPGQRREVDPRRRRAVPGLRRRRARHRHPHRHAQRRRRAHRSRPARALPRPGSVRRDRAAPGQRARRLRALGADRRSRGRARARGARDAPRGAGLPAPRPRRRAAWT